MPDPTSRLNAALEGRYSIERQLGEGGMATVYLARDDRHDRLVALKVLKPELLAVVGAERFLAEIRTTANLQHPHILPLFDSGEADGLVYYVMPFVDGESLRERLDRERQLPVTEAIGIATKVLAALEYAHAQGVVHRDVKPANILVSDAGEPLVADFGIALAVSQAGEGRFTETGLSLGTPHYMSPEQATGDRGIDRRSDIYAAGGVLYEMLAGSPPFVAPTAQAVLAKILTEEAPSVSGVRKTVPEHVSLAIRRSLERLPADRFSSAADFSEALNEARATTAMPGAPSRRPAGVPTWAWGAWVVSLAAMAWALWPTGSEERPTLPALSFTVTPADDAPIRSSDPPQLSPDQTTLVFVAIDEGRPKLQIRRMDSPTAEWLNGTEGARDPFFSADGESVGFFSEAGLRTIHIPTGTVIPLAESETLGTFQQSAVWLANGWILLSHEDSPDLWGVPPGGGTPIRVVDHSQSEGAVRLTVAGPFPLSETSAVVAVEGVGGTAWPAEVDVEDRSLIRIAGEGYPVGLWSDTLVLGFQSFTFVDIGERSRAGSEAMGEVLDLRLEVDGVLFRNLSSTEQFHLWSDLLIATSSASVDDRDVAWVSRGGAVEPVNLPPGSWGLPRLSPDGERLLILGAPASAGLGGDQSAQTVVDLRTGTRTPLDRGGEHTWSHDGSSVFFSEAGSTVGRNGIARQRADGSAGMELVLEGQPSPPWVTDISPDGETLLFYSENIRALDLNSGEARVLIDDPGVERNGQFSPDGAYIAYSSTGSGREEVYVRPYPALDERWTVSTEGGEMPMWSPDGSELFYVSGDRVMVTSAIADGDFESSRPTEFVRGGFFKNPNGDQSYDVAADGRLVMIRGKGDATITVTTGWLEAALAAAER